MTEIKTEISKNTEQDQDTFILPKNIRQMGTPGQRHKFYIEDYVYTYLHTFLKEKNKEDTLQAAVLLGHYEVREASRYTFVNGAAACDFSVFYEGAEGQIRETIREHFPELVIVGWYVRCSGQDSHVQSVIKHYYAEKDSAISLAFVYEDELEDEFGVYVWEQNALRSLDGFYIYYEKNPQMQEFLIREKGGQASEPAEITARSISESEQIHKTKVSAEIYKIPEKKKTQKLIYAACAVVLIVVTATGVTQIGDYQNLNNFQKTIQTMSGNLLNREDETENSSDNNGDKTSADAGGNSVNLSEEDVNNNQTAAWQERNEKADEQQEQSTNQKTAESAENAEETNKKEDNLQDNNTVKNSTEKNEDAAKAAGTQNVLSESQKALQQGYYIVKKGDSLVTISRKLYKTDAMVDSICAANGIGNVDVIYEGQKLKLP